MAKRKCKFCGIFGNNFIKTPGGSYCTFEHAISHAKEKQAKATDKARKAAERAKKAVNQRMKKEYYDNDRSTRLKYAQKAFNAFIRERDSGEPCISCGRFHAGQYHAGHYKSVGGNPALRFEESNCHRQCSVCNNHKSGNIADYRSELIQRIGLDQVEWLEGPHEPKKYTCEELKQIELYYKQKLKDLKRLAA